jgi:hypothetical protein
MKPLLVQINQILTDNNIPIIREQPYRRADATADLLINSIQKIDPSFSVPASATPHKIAGLVKEWLAKYKKPAGSGVSTRRRRGTAREVDELSAMNGNDPEDPLELVDLLGDYLQRDELDDNEIQMCENVARHLYDLGEISKTALNAVLSKLATIGEEEEEEEDEEIDDE